MNGTAIVLPLALLLLAVVTQLAANGVIKRNGFAGIRIPSTVSDDAAWLAGHKAAVTPAWIGFAVGAAAGVGDLLTQGSIQFLVVVFIAFIATLVVTVYAASRSARAARRPESASTA